MENNDARRILCLEKGRVCSRRGGVHEVPAEVFKECDPAGRSFCNINTPQEYFALREKEREEVDTADAPGEDAAVSGQALPTPRRT
jgi:hypothetical protein